MVDSHLPQEVLGLRWPMGVTEYGRVAVESGGPFVQFLVAGGHHGQHLCTVAQLIALLIASQGVPPLPHLGIDLPLKLIALGLIRKHLVT